MQKYPISGGQKNNLYRQSKYILLIIVYILIVFSTIDTKTWWDSNLGFYNKKFIISCNKLLMLLFPTLLVILYIWVKSPNMDLLFAFTIMFLFSSFISTFLYCDVKTGFYIGIILFCLIAYITGIFFLSSNLINCVLSFFITCFTGYFLYHLNCVKI